VNYKFTIYVILLYPRHVEQTLMNAGLTKLQAQAYLYLIEHGTVVPKELTDKLDISRTNAYKVLDSLEELQLVNKIEINKKIVYSPADPTALASLVAEKRNDVIAVEQSINIAIQQLRSTYTKQNKNTILTTRTGKKAMIKAYEEQAELKQSIYFYKTRADIPFMGFEAMDKIRRLQGKKALKRFAITTDSPEAPLNNEIDASTNLNRTWISENSYTAPVEWSVSGDQLLIQVFNNKGATVVIDNTFIAEAFKQIWKLSDNALRSKPSYKQLPLRAKRLI
jgi:sugar-specific transcriptional regulator TrmB